MLIGYLRGKLSYRVKYALKRYRRKLFNVVAQSGSLDYSGMLDVLTDRLGIKTGDTLMVHSSFGSLNAEFTPAELIDLLIALVGPEGNLLMPYYPQYNPEEMLEKKIVFSFNDMHSSMGVLTNVFAQRRDVVISPHPIKAVAVWGRDKEYLTQQHSASVTPFDKSSPYYKASELGNAKAIGIGIERMTFFHACEDLYLPGIIGSLYLEKPYVGVVKDRDNRYFCVKTFVHDPDVMRKRETPCNFIKRTGCPNYKFFKVNNAVFYSVDLKVVEEHLKQIFWGSPACNHGGGF
ncbi:MAG: AAC(3) family N-acetyltransferase [Deltaproteobacteria bacterium]|nr:AAC(3) family N-acetyltransferase [Deltaproteobacteria bacterium]